MGPIQGVWGTEVPQWGPGRSPGRGSGGRSPPEADDFSQLKLEGLFRCALERSKAIRQDNEKIGAGCQASMPLNTTKKTKSNEKN